MVNSIPLFLCFCSKEKIKEFQSIKEASKEFHVKDSTILSVCQGKNKTSCGFIWKYKEEYDNKTN